MRKMTLAQPLLRRIGLFCVATFGLFSLPTFGQGTAAAVTMPSDPKALMRLAYKSNGLTGDDVKPWHLKASYKLLDDQGNVTDQGTYEELWVSPTKYKRTFTGSAFAYSEYGTEKGVLVSGDQKLQFSRADEVRGEFIDPLPSAQLIEQNSYVLRKLEVGGVKLACLNLKDFNGDPFGTTWCMDTDRPTLRIAAPKEERRVHNNVIQFQVRSIPGDLQLVRAGKPFLTAHLDSLELLKADEQAALLPPPDAAPLRVSEKVVSILGGVASGYLLRSVRPDYPAVAKAAHVQGKVVLQAVIDTDGHIADLHVMSGPDLLQPAAVEAVRQWVYRPYLINGEPVKVDTTINVIFALGR
jgi:TonB family protein